MIQGYHQDGAPTASKPVMVRFQTGPDIAGTVCSRYSDLKGGDCISSKTWTLSSCLPRRVMGPDLVECQGELL